MLDREALQEAAVSANPAVVAALSELGAVVLEETPLEQLMQRITEIAHQALPKAAGASLTVVSPRRSYSGGATDDRIRMLDETQTDVGHGPCIEAAAGNTVIIVQDMREETRWPTFGPRALEAGIHSSASIPLPIQQDVVMGLNVFAEQPYAFGEEDIAVLSTIARYAAVAVRNLRQYADTAALAQQMQQAMESRAVIEQAKGIIMGDRRCSPDEAFGILAKLSQDTNRKLRDVAAALVDSAQRPRA